MLEHRNFVKKLVFAVETLPVNLVVAGLVTELFAIVLYCVLPAGHQSHAAAGAALAAGADRSADSVHRRA